MNVQPSNYSYKKHQKYSGGLFVIGVILFAIGYLAGNDPGFSFVINLFPLGEESVLHSFTNCRQNNPLYYQPYLFIKWQEQRYGKVTCDQQEFEKREQIWRQTEEGRQAEETAKKIHSTFSTMRIISFLLRLIGILAVIPWLRYGFVGGWRIATNYLRGKQWWWVMLLLGLIPLALFVIYLVIMSFLGRFAYELSLKSVPSMKRCPHCRSWIPYEANVCKHCTRPM